MNMETILFSKTDKIKIVTFAAVAFGLPWLLLPQIRVEGILAYNIPASYMMILPTSVLYWEELSVSEKFMGGFIGFIQLLLSRVLR